MNEIAATRLSLGPLQFHWPKAQMQSLYRHVADSPVDIVYLGETVCSRRREFRHQDGIDTAEQLSTAGKSVVLRAAPADVFSRIPRTRISLARGNAW